MKTTRKKIVVLSGLKNDIDGTIRSAAGMAKMIDAEVDFFHVKKPTEIVNKESQLSAIRTINREQIKMERQLKDLIEPYAAKYDVRINCRFSMGNVKSEIEDFINKTKPDMVVMGKRKSGPLKIIGDRVTDFVLDTFPGIVLITPDVNALEPQKELSIGVLNADAKTSSTEGLNDFMKHADHKIKSFRIIEKGQNQVNESNQANDRMEFVFEKNDNTISKLSDYLEKSQVSLLYLNRNDNKSRKTGVSTIPLKDIINKVNVPMLLTNDSNISLN